MFEYSCLGGSRGRSTRIAVFGLTAGCSYVWRYSWLLYNNPRGCTEQVISVIHRPPHPSFPLQGRVTASTSRTDVRVEYKEIHTSEPLGSWARLAQLLTSISELYIIFERV
jgi:hypothetical protein